MDIATLSPYHGKGRWRLKGRVTSKSDVRKFNSQARGPGQLFKITICDRAGGEISATFFGQGVDAHYNRVHPGKVYYFSAGTIKVGNPQYDSSINIINFDHDAKIEEVEEDRSIPSMVYSFQPVHQVLQAQVGAVVDVKGVLCEAKPVSMITMKADGRQRPKRGIILWDDSGPEKSAHIELTIWGDHAQDEYPAGTAAFVKCARVSEFNNMKGLNTTDSTVVVFEHPDQPAAAQELLQRWVARGQPATPANLLGGGGGRRATVQELHEENLNLGPPPEPGQPIMPNQPTFAHRHSVVGTITSVFTDRPPYYAACGAQVDGRDGKQRPCNKKLAEEDGSWRCASGHACQQPCYRYLCRGRLADHTGVLEFSSFDEAGRKIFGCEASELAVLWDDDARAEELQQKLKRPLWERCVFNVRSQRETFQDEERVKVSANDVQQVDIAKEARKKLAEIHSIVGPVEGPCEAAAAQPRVGGVGGA